MTDQLFIYLIVALNLTCQLMLIWRQKFTPAVRWKYISSAVAIPLVIMVSMRILIAGGMIHGHLSEQSSVEQYITKAMSILLIAGPWLVTIAAIMLKVRTRTALQSQPM